jgi:hypothetical protein
MCINIKKTPRTRTPLIQKNCESASDKLNALVYIFTDTCGSHTKILSGIFFETVVLQITLRSLACNKLEVSGRKCSDVGVDVTSQCHNKI